MANPVQSFDPSSIAFNSNPFTRGGAGSTWGAAGGTLAAPYVPGQKNITVSSFGGYSPNGENTQAVSAYTLNPQTGQYELSNYTPGQKSDAGSWMDTAIKGASMGTLGLAGGLGAASSLGLTAAPITDLSTAAPAEGGLGSAAAPITDLSTVAPAEAGAGAATGAGAGSTLSNIKNGLGIVNGANQLVNSNSSQGPNWPAIIAAGGLGAALGSQLGGSSTPAGATSGGTSATNPYGGAAPATNLPPPRSWADFQAREGAPQQPNPWQNPHMAALLGLNPGDQSMRSLQPSVNMNQPQGMPQQSTPPQGMPPQGMPPQGFMPNMPPQTFPPQGGLGAMARPMGPGPRPMPFQPGQPNPNLVNQPVAFASGGSVSSSVSAPIAPTNPLMMPGAGESGAATTSPVDSTVDFSKMDPLAKAAYLTKILSPQQEKQGYGYGANDVSSRIAQLTNGLRPTIYHGGAGYAEGGLSYVHGAGGGQADTVPAKLSSGEYVMDADAVSALGDGNNTAGAKKLDQMREAIRAHKRSAPTNKIPPKAKSPEAYLSGKRK